MDEQERMGQHDTRVVSIVDDDASLRRSLRNLLTSVGFRVETFASAEDFLGSVQRETTACLVLDLRMVGMNGLDLLRHLAVTDSGIPVVILTAHGDDEARQRALEAGAVAFLGKPFRADDLLGAVRTALVTGSTLSGSERTRSELTSGERMKSEPDPSRRP